MCKRLRSPYSLRQDKAVREMTGHYFLYKDALVASTSFDFFPNISILINLSQIIPQSISYPLASFDHREHPDPHISTLQHYANMTLLPNDSH